MLTVVNRLLSLGVAGLYLWAAAHTAAPGIALIKTLVHLTLPMACIWFGDTLGEYTGFMSGITNATPGFLVAFGGWLVLVGVPLIIIALSYS